MIGADRGRRARAAHALVFARDHRDGLAASLRAGLARAVADEREVFVFLGDMPACRPALPARLARGLRPGMAAVRPRGAVGPGHPVLLRRPDRETIDRLRGDRGLGALIAGRTRWIATRRRRPADIDTRRDLARWR